MEWHEVTQIVGWVLLYGVALPIAYVTVMFGILCVVGRLIRGAIDWAWRTDMQQMLPDEYRVFIYVCRCGRPVLKAFTYERDGEKYYTCSCSPGEEWHLDSAKLEKMNGGDVS